MGKNRRELYGEIAHNNYYNFSPIFYSMFLIYIQIFNIMFYSLFPAINKGDTKDTEMEAIMDNIVESLFSVFVTLGKYS